MTNERIKKIRTDKGLTQEEFGERLNLSQTHVASLENGKRKLTERVAKDICRIFYINMDWLEHGNSPMYRNILSNPDTDELVKCYNMLDDSDKNLINQIISSFMRKS